MKKKESMEEISCSKQKMGKQKQKQKSKMKLEEERKQTEIAGVGEDTTGQGWKRKYVEQPTEVEVWCENNQKINKSVTCQVSQP